MTRSRRLRAHIAAADVLAGAGIACLTIGAGLAWVPAGFIVAGVLLLLVARYGTEAT